MLLLKNKIHASQIFQNIHQIKPKKQNVTDLQNLRHNYETREAFIHNKTEKNIYKVSLSH